MIESYLKKINEQKVDLDLQRKIIVFFKENPKPSDSQVHSFAEKNGINKHKFEEYIYELLGSFFGQIGRASCRERV